MHAAGAAAGTVLHAGGKLRLSSCPLVPCVAERPTRSSAGMHLSVTVSDYGSVCVQAAPA